MRVGDCERLMSTWDRIRDNSGLLTVSLMRMNNRKENIVLSKVGARSAEIYLDAD